MCRGPGDRDYIKETLRLRVCVGENVKLQDSFSMSYLAASRTITFLHPHGHLPTVSTHTGPSIQNKNFESLDLLIGYRLEYVFVAMLPLVTLTVASHQSSLPSGGVWQINNKQKCLPMNMLNYFLYTHTSNAGSLYKHISHHLLYKLQIALVCLNQVAIL